MSFPVSVTLTVFLAHIGIKQLGKLKIIYCSAVSSISEQVNLFKRQSSVSVCVRVCVNYVNE